MNIAQVLKAEIARISKKETKALGAPTRSAAIQLKKTVASMKKRLASLEKANNQLQKQVAELVACQPKPQEEEGTKVRVLGKGIKSLRRKLKLTREEFGKLAGVSSHAVYLWEGKSGALKLRDATRKAILSVKGLGAREAKARLAEMGTADKPVKKARKARKASGRK